MNRGELAARTPESAWHSEPTPATSEPVRHPNPRNPSPPRRLWAAMIGTMIAPLLLAFSLQESVSTQVKEVPSLNLRASAVSPDHTRLAIETLNEGLLMVNITKKQVEVLGPPRGSDDLNLAWSADGSALAVLRYNAQVDVLDAASGAIRSSFQTTKANSVHDAPPNTQAYGMAKNKWPDRTVTFADGGTVIIVALGGPVTELWPVTGGKRIAQLSVREGHETTAMSVARDGETIALGSDHGEVAVWKVRTPDAVLYRQDIPGLRGNHRPIHALAFDPTGKTLAIGGGDCCIRLMKLGSTDPMEVLSHGEDDLFGDLKIGGLCFNSDGSRLLSTSYSYWVARLWDTKSGRGLGHFGYENGREWPMRAWLSSDGKYVTTQTDCGVALEGKHHFEDWPLKTGSSWRSDGDVAWTVQSGSLLVRTVDKDEPLLLLPARKPSPK